jgi:hypothetical protein
MSQTRSAAISDPIAARSAQALAMEAWRRAVAMGLIDPGDRPWENVDLAVLFDRLREVGIARGAALRFGSAGARSVEEMERLLRLVIAALDASPLPKHEWPVLARTLDTDQLASLLGVSVTSLRRYVSGERETPDAVAARVHHLALIVGDLAGAYNDVGIRRWFDRARSALDGKSPAALLAGEWNPDDPDPQRVRALAQSLVDLSAA